MARLLSDFVLDMLLSIQAAVKLDPDVICVCLPRAGATIDLTYQLMETLYKELQLLERESRARPLVGRCVVEGLIIFVFTSIVQVQQIYPERPALELCTYATCVHQSV